jgi:DNA-binding transcriptional LysR family regulator
MVKERVETFKIGASYIIGSYILPGAPLNIISKVVDKKIKLNITSCDRIIRGVESGEFNLGLIENRPFLSKKLIYKKWLEDELVICSKIELPKIIKREDLKKLNLITRDEDSPTKQTISKFFKEAGISHKDFHSTIKADNPTALIQGVKWSRPNINNPTISITSKIAIEDELRDKKLYMSRIENLIMRRDFYLVYYNNPNSKNENLQKVIFSLLKEQIDY